MVDDEPDILELVALNLKKAGFKTKEFLNGQSFQKYLSNNLPDLIILDLMLPDTDGFEICKVIKRDKRTAHIPVIMLTARGEELDKVLGLELGADDYVTKPFSTKELIARVKAILRRKSTAAETKTIKIGDAIIIDTEKYEISVKDKKIETTTTEFRILELLAKNKGIVFSRDKILTYLWGEEKAVIDRTIDVHIKHLREKLGKTGALIKNVRGIGYKLEV
ncbi:MAG: response regulator transcription factor [Candidatus Margulisbacteria bacterium]|nr:response regulator transcription factor [Candidatus Margulisiibacteriota bacterium]